MTAPINKMLRGLEEYFLAKDAITARIKNRLTRGIEQARLLAFERPDTSIATRLGEYAEYELAGGERGLLLNVKSKMHVATVAFRFFSMFPEDAAALFDVFHDSFSGDRLSTTWGSTGYQTKVMGARWDESSASDDHDTNIGMCFMSVPLIVPFAEV
jgi:hypothetical protein